MQPSSRLASLPYNSPKQELQARIRGDYGQWLLIELYSGRWAPIWHACAEQDEYCESILLEEQGDFFHDEPAYDGGKPNPTYRTAHEALEKIISDLAEEAREGHLEDVFAPIIKRAKRDYRTCLENATNDSHLRRAKRSEGQTALYRYRSADGALLYVSTRLLEPDMLESQANEKGSEERVALIAVEWHPTRDVALEAKKSARLIERPRWEGRSLSTTKASFRKASVNDFPTRAPLPKNEPAVDNGLRATEIAAQIREFVRMIEDLRRASRTMFRLHHMGSSPKIIGELDIANANVLLLLTRSKEKYRAGDASSSVKLWTPTRTACSLVSGDLVFGAVAPHPSALEHRVRRSNKVAATESCLEEVFEAYRQAVNSLPIATNRRAPDGIVKFGIYPPTDADNRRPYRWN